LWIEGRREYSYETLGSMAARAALSASNQSRRVPGPEDMQAKDSRPCSGTPRDAQETPRDTQRGQLESLALRYRKVLEDRGGRGHFRTRIEVEISGRRDRRKRC